MSGSGDLVARLNRLDCCAVSDALDKLGLSGAVTGLKQFAAPRRIAGRIVTVTLGPGTPPPGPPRHLCTAAIEAAQTGDVIVVEHRSGIECGGWGGILSLGAKLRGVAGVIVEGYARDIDECRAIDFPVYARALTCRTARGRIVEQATNTPIAVGDIRVEPGDLAIADGSGAAFIKAADAARIIAAAEAIAGREAAMAQALLGGAPIGQVMGASYEHMLKE